MLNSGQAKQHVIDAGTSWLVRLRLHQCSIKNYCLAPQLMAHGQAGRLAGWLVAGLFACLPSRCGYLLHIDA